MPSAAGSIPPLAPSRPPPAVVLRSDRFAAGAHARSAVAVARRRARGQGTSAPVLSLVPPPPAARPIPHAPPIAARASTAPAPLTAIAFRPDGRPALTLRLRALHGLAALVLASGAVGVALALGWAIGEWTARL